MYSSGEVLYIKDRYLGSTLHKEGATYIQWADNKEAVYTNSRSWRVRSAEDKMPYQSDIVIAGASWTMGVGVDYSESFVGHLEDYLQKKIALLSVGSSSFVQLMRFLEREIDVIKPKVVMIAYGTWLVKRSLVDRDTPMHYRPVLKRDKKTMKIVINEARTPPDFLTKHYARYQRKLRNKYHQKSAYSGSQTFGEFKYPFFSHCYLALLEFFGKVYHGYPMAFIKRIFRLNRYKRIGCHTEKEREEILRYCLNSILKTTKKHRAKLIVQHLYEYPVDSPYAEMDRELLTRLSKDMGFDYHDWKPMEKKFKNFLSQKNLTIQDHLGVVTWVEHCHPNKNGHWLIAESMYPVLKNALN